jgi:D-proline reductase (dithiol) PrdB
MQPVRYIELVNSVTSELPPLPIAELGPPVLTPLGKPLKTARVMLVTSAGVHLRSDPPFARVNDLSFREIAATVSADELRPSHPTPVRRPGEQDINVVYPYERLAELAGEGLVGAGTAYHLSFLGTIKRLTVLVTDLAVGMVASARRAGADAVLLVPL